MAILKVVNQKGKYHDLKSWETIVPYVTNPEKARSGYIGMTQGVNPCNIAGSMSQVIAQFSTRGKIQLRHIIISFPPQEVSNPSAVFNIAKELAQFTCNEYQTLYAVHENTNYLHIHFVHNYVSFVDGHRYRGQRNEYYAFKNYLKSILRRYGIYRLDEVSPKSDRDIQVG